jgi:hypothetical protein
MVGYRVLDHQSDGRYIGSMKGERMTLCSMNSFTGSPLVMQALLFKNS